MRDAARMRAYNPRLMNMGLATWQSNVFTYLFLGAPGCPVGSAILRPRLKAVHVTIPAMQHELPGMTTLSAEYDSNGNMSVLWCQENDRMSKARRLNLFESYPWQGQDTAEESLQSNQNSARAGHLGWKPLWGG